MSELIRLETVDSTNLYALQNFAELADGAMVVAYTQTEGKGRRGRKWVSPPGKNIYASFVLKRADASKCAPWIGCIASLNTLKSFTEKSDLWIKWPNDVFCGTKKIAGVLCESHSAPASNVIDGIVVGIGVNLNMTMEEVEAIGVPATSILIETGVQSEIAEFAEVLQRNLLKISKADEKFIYGIWKKENRLIGKKVSVQMENGEKSTGIFKYISDEGNLVMLMDGNFERSFSSGDVSVEASDFPAHSSI